MRLVWESTEVGKDSSARTSWRRLEMRRHHDTSVSARGSRSLDATSRARGINGSMTSTTLATVSFATAEAGKIDLLSTLLTTTLSSASSRTPKDSQAAARLRKARMTRASGLVTTTISSAI